jgi:hypothetical protein
MSLMPPPPDARPVITGQAKVTENRVHLPTPETDTSDSPVVGGPRSHSAALAARPARAGWALSSPPCRTLGPRCSTRLPATPCLRTRSRRRPKWRTPSRDEELIPSRRCSSRCPRHSSSPRRQRACSSPLRSATCKNQKLPYGRATWRSKVGVEANFGVDCGRGGYGVSLLSLTLLQLPCVGVSLDSIEMLRASLKSYVPNGERVIACPATTRCDATSTRTVWSALRSPCQAELCVR